MNDNWKCWDNDVEYGENFYNRAIGNKEEMQSSKALAKIIKNYIKNEDKVLDIGCGGGHYLLSIERQVDVNFTYHGVDATKNYIVLAKKAFENREKIKCSSAFFEQGDIYNLRTIPDNHAEIVMCNNLLLHLPSIEKPIDELIRVTKKTLIIRTLVGKSSFRNKFINNEDEEYDKNGEPVKFHYLNIYSKDYIGKLIKKHKNIKSFKIIEDRDFNPNKIGINNWKEGSAPNDTTIMLDGYQTTQYIIMPWCFIVINI